MIIVITILVILATIAFLNFGNYGAEARDAVRKADLENIKKALELYKIENGEYISPGNSKKSEDFEGWTDGFITEEVGGKLRFGKVPVDPLGDKAENKYYKYSVSDDGDAYKLEVDYELEGKLVLGNISSSCQDIFTNNQFRGNGVYKAYSSNYKPINIYCHQDYKNNTFFDEIIGGDMEREDLMKNLNLSQNLSISTEENSTQNGKNSIKVSGFGGLIFDKFTYVDSSKKYKISGKFKNFRDNNPGRVFLGFAEYDKDFKLITPDQVNIIENTETYITRSTPKNSKKIYFWCDDNFFNNLNKKYNNDTVVAYDIKEYLSDLPNKNTSTTIGNRTNKTTRNVSGFLKKLGNNECSLETRNYFKESNLNDKIRFHQKTGYYNYSGADYKEIPAGEWFELSGEIDGFWEHGVKVGKFRKSTVFIKPYFRVNAWNHYEGDIFSENNPNSTTYVDDLKLEVIK